MQSKLPDSPHSPAPESQYRRYGLFAFAVLLHIAVFFLVCHLTIFPATQVTPDAASFQAATITIPTKPVTPPPPPSSSAAMPSIAVPAAPTPVVAITAPTRSSFTMPKIDIISITAHMPSLTPSQAPTATPGTGHGNANGAGQGNGSGIGIITDATAEFMAAIPKGQLVVETAPWRKSLFPHGDSIDTIQQLLRQAGATGVAINISSPFGTPYTKWTFNSGSHIPPVDPLPGEIVDITIAEIRFSVEGIERDTTTVDDNGDKHHAQVAAFVWFDNFNTGLSTFDITDMRSKLDCLRGRGIRLFVVAYEHPVYQPMLEYVRESGGKVLYPGGIPDAVTAALMVKALPHMDNSSHPDGFHFGTDNNGKLQP